MRGCTATSIKRPARVAFILIFAYAILYNDGALAYSAHCRERFPLLSGHQSKCRSSMLLWAENRSSNPNPSRRGVFISVGFASIAEIMVIPTGTIAASPTGSSTSEIRDKENIIKGYQRLNFLLRNWDKETEICGKKNDGIVWEECDRSPEKVMEYLGFKSMNDPLFKADKAIKRLQTLVSEENDDEYQEAYQKWVQNSEEGKDMAYISSWGEANPGGGLDVKAAYIERARKDVEEARESLATIIRLLGLKVE